MERGDSINMAMPTPDMNSSASMLGLDMQLSSQGHHPSHLQFQPHDPNSQPHHGHGPIRPQHTSNASPSTYSPYGPSIARVRQVSPLAQHMADPDDSDVVSKRPGGGPASQQACPWGRMKWTESMVRLLIAEVYRVGDDGGGTDGGDHHVLSAKGVNRAGGAAKGKWKSVSKSMMDKGYSVSPQQCEDKFNDLNKRYKRVIDLLGKGIACRVVENPTLLDSMDHLSPKAKEEARKLLSSKHLFFPEMCAYHNAGAPPCTGTASQHPSNSQVNVQSDQQQCMHHQSTGGTELARYPQVNHPKHNGHAVGSSDEEEDNNMSDNESNDSSNKEDGGYDSDYYQRGEVGVVKKQRNAKHHAANSPPLSLSLCSTSGGSTAVQQLKNELAGVVANGGENVRQWMKRRSAELEEQKLGYQLRAYQLERQRFKWLRYSSNKEREMEKMRLHNDRLRLENERMLLLIRQKEMELCGFENTGTGAAAASSTEQLQLQQPQYIQK